MTIDPGELRTAIEARGLGGVAIRGKPTAAGLDRSRDKAAGDQIACCFDFIHAHPPPAS